MGENTHNSVGAESRFSLLDSRFSESDTSLQIFSINNNNTTTDNNNKVHGKGTSGIWNGLNKRQALGRLSNISIDNRRGENDVSGNIIPMSASSSMLETSPMFSNSMISGDGPRHSSKSRPILDELYTTPDTNHFDDNDSFYSPDTPNTPLTPFLQPRTPHSNYKGFNQEENYASSNERTFSIDEVLPIKKRYPLLDAELEKFVLNTDIFELSLGEKIGKGSNAYVFSCELSTKNLVAGDQLANSFNVAVKIPSSRNKVKHILQEAKFALKLRQYQTEWFSKNNRVYPFIDCYGFYYLGKEDFPLFKSPQELLPCLVMKKMTMSLPEYIKVKVQSRKDLSTKTNSPYTGSAEFQLPVRHWWKLCNTLIDALTVLKQLKSVHCDIKTENVMVICYGDSNEDNHEDDLDSVEFKVIDFSSAAEVKTLTKCPDMTLQYTAPELLHFGSPRIPTYSSDAYSAGLVLYEAATGSPPFSSAGYDHFLLVGVVKEGRVFDWATPEDLSALSSEPAATQVIRQLVEERRSVEELSAVLSNTPM